MKRLLKPKIAILKLEPEDDEIEKDGQPEKKVSGQTGKKHKDQIKPKKKRPGVTLKGRVGEDANRLSLTDVDPDLSVIEKLDEDMIIEKEWMPVSADTKWECIRCGWCCQQNWRINMTWREYDRIRKYISVTEMVVDEETGMSHPVYTINGRCEKYNTKSHKCEIYRNRLYTCAAFPFILDDDELLRSKHCKGFGSGELVDKKKMKKFLVKWRKKAGLE